MTDVNKNPASEFENIVNNIQSGKKPEQHKPANSGGGQKKGTVKSSAMPDSAEVFDFIIKQNQELDSSMQELTREIESIRTNNQSSLEKNLTFSISFKALDVAIQEYQYQSSIFEQYTKMYDEMCNEENIVKVLDLLRMIVTDRRAILNDIMSNLLRIQKLDNERIKMDAGTDDDTEIIDEMVNPDSV